MLPVAQLECKEKMARLSGFVLSAVERQTYGLVHQSDNGES
jgi:hypothetical protein